MTVKGCFTAEAQRTAEASTDNAHILKLDYRWSPLGGVAKQALRKGENVIAVMCEQERHKAFIDLGLVELKPHTSK